MCAACTYSSWASFLHTTFGGWVVPSGREVPSGQHTTWSSKTPGGGFVDSASSIWGPPLRSRVEPPLPPNRQFSAGARKKTLWKLSSCAILESQRAEQEVAHAQMRIWFSDITQFHQKGLPDRRVQQQLQHSLSPPCFVLFFCGCHF